MLPYNVTTKQNFLMYSLYFNFATDFFPVAIYKPDVIVNVDYRLKAASKYARADHQ